MPSVGGGGGGGGFHGGGGSFGGGGGGGFHGGGYYGGYYRGGGIFGSIISAILSPIIFAIVGIICLVIYFSSLNGPKTVSYDETKFQNYALGEYKKIYGNDEYDILVVFLASKTPENDGYYQISMVGDYIVSQVNDMFGGDTTVFGKALDDGLPQAYNNSLTPAFSGALETTASCISSLYGNSVFRNNPPTEMISGKLINRTDYTNINADVVTTAIRNFENTTGISISILVEDVDNVFERSSGLWIILIVGIVCLLIAFFLIFAAVKAVKAFKNRRSGRNGGSSNGRGYTDGGRDDDGRDDGGKYY